MLKEDNRYLCDKCKAKRIASKRIHLTNWKKYLIVCLKRFTYDSKGNLKKNNSEITCPYFWRHNYILVGGVIHHGSLNGGHYVYFGRYDKKWFLFNDSNVSELPINHVDKLKKNAYILLYEQIH